MDNCRVIYVTSCFQCPKYDFDAEVCTLLRRGVKPWDKIDKGAVDDGCPLPSESEILRAAIDAYMVQAKGGGK